MDKDTNSKFTEEFTQWDIELWKKSYEIAC